jgi:hypothetical protein
MMTAPVERSQLRGLVDNDRQIPQHWLRRALSPTFPAGEMVFFIPWRVVAEDSGAAHLDLLGPALRLLTDVADFHFSDIAVRGDDGARTIGANDDAAARYGATGSTAPTPLIENGVDWTTRVTLISHPTRAREVLMMAGAGGAMRATGWRATAIPFQQFGEREGTLGFRSFARNSMHLLRSFGPRRVCLPQRACKFSRKNCMKACSGAAIRRPLG